MTRRFSAVLLAAMLSVFVPGGAYAAEASALADGRAWDIKNMKNGRTGRMTLNADGTGTIGGRGLTFPITWQAQGANGLCIDGARGAPGCVSLEGAPGGYNGVRNGQVVMTLRR